MSDFVCIVEIFPGVLEAISSPMFDLESHYHEVGGTVELKTAVFCVVRHGCHLMEVVLSTR